MFNLVICDTSVADSLQSECFHWDLVSMTKTAPFSKAWIIPESRTLLRRAPSALHLGIAETEPETLEVAPSSTAGEKLGTDVSPTFPNRGVFLDWTSLKHVCFLYKDIDILDFFGGTEIKVLGPLITWQAQG